MPRDAAALAWMANLGCLELHPHPVRAEDLDHPDELRVDLDPVPGVAWPQLLAVAEVVREVLADLGLVGWPKTSGSRGIHVNVRIHRRWSFAEVRRAALALAREVERRAPALATSKWWKEERHGVFLDYNQNAKDRTVASAYSVRPKPDARVSAPVTWDELGRVPAGGLHAAHHAGALRRDRRPARAASTSTPARSSRCSSCRPARRREGLGDAPWPPALRQAAGRAAARRAVAPEAAPVGRRPPRLHEAAGRDRPRAQEGRRAGRARALEGAPPRGRRHLQPADVLVDSMRGRSSTWTRVRVNLEHVPEALRPAQEPLDPRPARTRSRAAGARPR